MDREQELFPKHGYQHRTSNKLHVGCGGPRKRLFEVFEDKPMGRMGVVKVTVPI